MDEDAEQQEQEGSDGVLLSSQAELIAQQGEKLVGLQEEMSGMCARFDASITQLKAATQHPSSSSLSPSANQPRNLIHAPVGRSLLISRSENSTLTEDDARGAIQAVIGDRKAEVGWKLTVIPPSEPRTQQQHTATALSARERIQAFFDGNTRPPLLIVKCHFSRYAEIWSYSKDLKAMGFTLSEGLTREQRLYKKQQQPAADQAWADGRIVSWRGGRLVTKEKDSRGPFKLYARTLQQGAREATVTQADRAADSPAAAAAAAAAQQLSLAPLLQTSWKHPAQQSVHVSKPAAVELNTPAGLHDLRNHLIIAIAACDTSLPSPEQVHWMAVRAAALQSSCGLSTPSLLDPGGTDHSSDSAPSLETGWELLLSLEIDQMVVKLLSALHPMLSPRAGKGPLQGASSSSSSSSSRGNTERGGAARNSNGSGSSVGALRHDRAAAAAKAQRALRERRLQSDPTHPFLLASLLGSSMSILVTLLAAAARSRGDVRAEALMLHSGLFQSLDLVAHHLLCGLRGCESTAEWSRPDPFPSGARPLSDAVLNCLTASCHLCHAMRALPTDKQHALITHLPPRFLDTLSCLASELPAHTSGGPGDRPERLAALVMVATLPRHKTMHTLLTGSGSAPDAHPSAVAVGALEGALSTPCFLRVTCLALLAKLAPPTGPAAAGPSCAARRASTREVLALVQALQRAFSLRRRREGGLRGAADVSAVTCSAVFQGGGGDRLSTGDASGAWALTDGVVSMPRLVTGLLRLGGRLGARGYQLPEYVIATKSCAHLAVDLIDLATGGGEGLGGSEGGTTAFQGGGTRVAARLAAVLARLFSIERQQQQQQQQPLAGADDTCQGTSRLSSDEQRVVGCCGPHGGVPPEGFELTDKFRRLVIFMLSLEAVGEQQVPRGQAEARQGRATAPAVVPDPHAADGSTSPVDQPASTHTHSTGTSGTPFRSTLEGALMGSVEVLGNMLTVSAMLEYQHKSHEELRWEDLQLTSGVAAPIEVSCSPVSATPSPLLDPAQSTPSRTDGGAWAHPCMAIVVESAFRLARPCSQGVHSHSLAASNTLSLAIRRFITAAFTGLSSKPCSRSAQRSSAAAFTSAVGGILSLHMSHFKLAGMLVCISSSGGGRGGSRGGGRGGGRGGSRGGSGAGMTSNHCTSSADACACPTGGGAADQHRTSAGHSAKVMQAWLRLMLVVTRTWVLSTVMDHRARLACSNHAWNPPTSPSVPNADTSNISCGPLGLRHAAWDARTADSEGLPGTRPTAASQRATTQGADGERDEQGTGRESSATSEATQRSALDGHATSGLASIVVPPVPDTAAISAGGVLSMHLAAAAMARPSAPSAPSPPPHPRTPPSDIASAKAAGMAPPAKRASVKAATDPPTASAADAVSRVAAAPTVTPSSPAAVSTQRGAPSTAPSIATSSVAAAHSPDRLPAPRQLTDATVATVDDVMLDLVMRATRGYERQRVPPLQQRQQRQQQQLQQQRQQLQQQQQ
ncbi:MAG: hypothetical protein WDW38_008109 [Sanguina aurantia]